MSRELLLEIIETLPQADPASEFYNEEINGCEAVNFLSQFIPQIREYLDAPPPKVAVVLDGGLVQCLTSDRPNDVPPITFMVIDYDTDGSTPENGRGSARGWGNIGSFCKSRGTRPGRNRP